MSKNEVQNMAESIITHIDDLIKEKFKELDVKINANRSDIEKIKKEIERINSTKK